MRTALPWSRGRPPREPRPRRQPRRDDGESAKVGPVELEGISACIPPGPIIVSESRSAVKPTRRFWFWSLLIALLAFIALPELLHSFGHYQFDRRITKERAKVAALVQAGDGGYDELVRLLPRLWFGNVPDALKGILAQDKRDRVADLCRAYVACGRNHNTKTELARTFQRLGDVRAAPVLLKDLESVWSELTLI